MASVLRLQRVTGRKNNRAVKGTLSVAARYCCTAGVCPEILRAGIGNPRGEELLPRYKFKWSNLGPSILLALSRDLLDEDDLDGDPAAALQAAYGARPTEEFIRVAWPTLLESWLRTTRESREWVVNALRETRGQKGRVSGRGAQMEFLRSLNNSKNLREIVWTEFIAAGEVNRIGEHDHGEEEAGPQSQHRPRQSTTSAKKPASRIPSNVNGSEPEMKSKDSQPPKQKKSKSDNRTLEQKLWEAADTLRGNQEPSEYKHVVLGLIFLKYISDRFEARRAAIEAALSDPESPDYIPNESRRTPFVEDRDEYTSHNVFWVPAQARWEHIQGRAKLPSIGQDIDTAMDLVEKENPSIRGVLPRNYGREGLDKERLGRLVDLIGSIGFTDTDDHGSDDVLGRVYEYFLGQFAGKETGKDAGAFYTPRSVVRTLVEMLEPFKGRVFDPACGSGGMFVQSAEFVKAHGGKRSDISIYGQEYTDTTWKLAKMNAALRGIEADLGERSADSFTHDLHPDLRADFVLANPPFNVSDWWDPKLADDPRWKYGVPPRGNANFAWVQHFVHHLSPRGTAGFVLANGSLTSNTTAEWEIRKNLVEADLVDCIVAMPEKLFFNTAIAVCLWFVSKDRNGNGHRRRRGEVLFINAEKMGTLVTKRLRELSATDIAKIANTYHSWRNHDGGYKDIPGFAKSVAVEELRKNDFVLTPGRYVGTAAIADDGEPVKKKIQRLAADLITELDRGRKLENAIRARLADGSAIQ